jgi:hypothetical protein
MRTGMGWMFRKLHCTESYLPHFNFLPTEKLHVFTQISCV